MPIGRASASIIYEFILGELSCTTNIVYHKYEELCLLQYQRMGHRLLYSQGLSTLPRLNILFHPFVSLSSRLTLMNSNKVKCVFSEFYRDTSDSYSLHEEGRLTVDRSLKPMEDTTAINSSMSLKRLATSAIFSSPLWSEHGHQIE